MEINKIDEVINTLKSINPINADTRLLKTAVLQDLEEIKSHYKAIIEEKDLQLEMLNKQAESDGETMNEIIKELFQAKELLERCLHSCESYTLYNKISEFLKK